MDLTTLTRDIVRYQLDKNMTDLNELLARATDTDKFYLTAAPGTTAEQWAARTHKANIQDKALLVFLDPRELGIYAMLHDLMADDEAMVLCLSAKKVKSVFQVCMDSGQADRVRVYAKLPFFVDCPAKVFLEEKPGPAPAQKEPEAPVSMELNIDEETVNKAKEILDQPRADLRNKLDPSGSYQNIHTLVDKMLRENGIAPAALDKAVGIQEGTTAQFCIDLKGTGTSTKIIRAYLDVFGLGAYLYTFKGQCRELTSETNASNIDQNPVKPAGVNTKERFKLESCRRGKDANGAYVYQLTLRSPTRVWVELVSSPFGYVVGREYSVEGLDDDDGQHVENSVRDIPKPPSKDVAEQVMEEVERKNKVKYKQQDEQDIAYKNDRKNQCILYLKKQFGCSSHEAEVKFNKLVWEEDLVDEFYQHIKNHKPCKINIRGYTAQILIKELRYSIYDAYCVMVDLRKKPRDTEQMLKYRKSDPQYQKDTTTKEQE